MTASEVPIVLDINVVSELARPQPDPAIASYLRSVSHRTLITSIVLGELHLGVELLPAGRRQDELRRHVVGVRDAYRDRIIPLTAPVVENYARAIAQLRQGGISMSVNDAYIAAATVTAGAHLCTRNVRDFESYPGLTLIDPLNP